MAKSQPVSHSELDIHRGRLYNTPKARYQLSRVAMQRVFELYGPGPRTVEIGERISQLTAWEQNTRLAHYYQFKSTLSYPLEDRVLTSGTDHTVESALVDFDTVVSLANAADKEHVWASNVKGLSSELGYVEQFGDWQAARELDDQVRQLTTSEILAQTGITLSHIHGSDEALVSYSLRLVASMDAARGFSLLGIRKRAVADVEGTDDVRYEIIRRSGFYIDETKLARKELKSIAQLRDLEENDRKGRKALFREFVGPIISDLVEHPEKRDSQRVLPVTSSYIVLRRH